MLRRRSHEVRDSIDCIGAACPNFNRRKCTPTKEEYAKPSADALAKFALSGYAVHCGNAPDPNHSIVEQVIVIESENVDTIQAANRLLDQRTSRDEPPTRIDFRH